MAASTASQRSMGRPFRYDGIMPQTDDVAIIRSIAERTARVRPQGATGEPFAIVVEGTSRPGADAFHEARA